MQRGNVNALRVSLETGMRINDVLSLRPEQVNGRVIRFTASKTGKDGTAKISADLYRELKQGANKDFVFPSRKAGKHRTRQAVYKDMKKACDILGVTGQISPHSARKTFAVELRKKSGIVEVQKALQHTDKETTMLYAFADAVGRSDSELANIADYIADVVCGKVCGQLEQMFAKCCHFHQKTEK
jgi:integrase